MRALLVALTLCVACVDPGLSQDVTLAECGNLPQYNGDFHSEEIVTSHGRFVAFDLATWNALTRYMADMARWAGCANDAAP